MVQSANTGEVHFRAMPLRGRWVCPVCETQIEEDQHECFLCGCMKQVWQYEQEMPITPEPAPAPIAYPQYSEDNGALRVFGIIMAVLVGIALLCIIATA